MTIKKTEETKEESKNNKQPISSLAKVEGIFQPLWGGYCTGNINNLSAQMLQSLSYDKRLYSAAIDVSKVQARMCMKRAIITETHCKQILAALDKIKREIANGNINLEDFSTNNIQDALKNLLQKEIGNVAEVSDIALSKAEHYVASMRLWIRDALDALDSALQNLQAALIDKAEANVKIILPTRLHSQYGQPVSLAHYLMAYVEMLGRDRSRISDIRGRTIQSPLGIYMGAGSSLDISRKMTAKMLDFESPILNSIDGIMDRDFVAEFIAASTICSTHLTKFVRDLISWQHADINFISIAEDFLSYDHILQRKRYPEILECIRAQNGNILGHLTNVIVTLSGTSDILARDYQEVVGPMISTYDILFNCINVVSAIVPHIIPNARKMREEAQSPLSLSPDILNWLLKNTTLNYNNAVVTTNNIINFAIAHKKKLSLLELSELQAIEPQITEGIRSVFIASRAVISRRSFGGSNPVQVKKTIRSSIRKHLAGRKA